MVVVVDAGSLGRELDEPRGDELAAAAAIGAENGTSLNTDADKMQCEDDRNGGGGNAIHETVAHLQLSSADSIIVNKTDTVTPTQLSSIEARIRSINGMANLTRTTYSRVERLEGVVVELNAYDTFVPEKHRAHAHLDPVQPSPHPIPFLFVQNPHHSSLPFFPLLHIHRIDNPNQTITTLTIPLPALATLQLDNLEQWLQQLLWETRLPSISPSLSPEASTLDASEVGSGVTIHRLKALFNLTDGTERMVQGVREVFEITTPAVADSSTSASGRAAVQAGVGGKGEEGKGEGEESEGMIVFIGRGLKERGESVERSLKLSLGL